jgi:hypothetical protein
MSFQSGDEQSNGPPFCGMTGHLYFKLAIGTEGAAQVVNPMVGDFPGDEVAAVLVNGDVDVVVP